MTTEVESLVRSTAWPSEDPSHVVRLQQAAAEALLSQAQALVRGVVENHASSQSSELATGDVEQILSGIVQLTRAPQAERTRVVVHPTFNYWVKAMRRASHGLAREQLVKLLPNIADFVWPIEVLLGATSREWCTQTDDRGGLRCPSVQRFIELGPQYASTRVRISSDGDTVFVSLPDGLNLRVPIDDLRDEVPTPGPSLEREGYAVSLAPLLGHGLSELWSRDEWLRVQFTGTHQRNDGIELFGSDDRWFPRDLDLTAFVHAYILMRYYWPAAYDEVGQFTRVLVPMASGASNTGSRTAFTVSSRQGAIFIDHGRPQEILDNVLHENAHIKLRQIQLLDPLLVDPHQEAPRFRVPWRADPRPLPGILEGVFVFCHVAELENRVIAAEGQQPTEKLRTMVGDVRAGVELLKEHASLTAVGLAFLHELEKQVARLEGTVGETAQLDHAASS